MNLTDLAKNLQATGYPVAYSHFDRPQQAPFVVYLEDDEDAMKADNTNYHTVMQARIELYTDKKDLIAEAAIKKALDDNHLPFRAFSNYIREDSLFQKIYEVRLI